MNPKALLFDKFLKDEEITSFERKDFDDEDGTVVYRSYIKSPLWDMPLFVILDNNPRCGICRYLSFLITVFTVLFVWCWALKR